MALDNIRAAQAYIDQLDADGDIDKDKVLEDDTADALGLPDGSTVGDMLHAKIDPLIGAIFDEITANADVSTSVDLSAVEVEAGIRVEDGNATKIGDTAEKGPLDQSSTTGSGGVS